MTSKRYLGNIITDTPTEPAGPFEDSAASGVWSLAEANAYTKAELWPTAGNAAPIGIAASFYVNGGSNVSIYSMNFTTDANSEDFGDLSVIRNSAGSVASSTRAVFAGGKYTADENVMDYVTIASSGNATDFGDLTQASAFNAGVGNDTRGVFYLSDNNSNVINYITIASAGNATDFGDISFYRNLMRNGAAGSTTRGLFMGGSRSTTRYNNIDYITIATAGNSLDFGDLTTSVNNLAACSSSVRAVRFGGTNSSSQATNTLDYMTIATTGNAVDFGDMSATSNEHWCFSNKIVGAVAGKSYDNTQAIGRINFATTGNMTDFGGIFASGQSTEQGTGTSNAHGGLAA